MQKIRIFISSVQTEFAGERELLWEYLCTDALLAKFFEPFIFEKVPALNANLSSVYLHEVEQCTIYLGIFGKSYGFEDNMGVSPTEREFDYATKLYKTRFVFLTNHSPEQRHPKILALIQKAEQSVVRKSFSAFDQLKTAVYATLVRYLEENEFIRTLPFDATLNRDATIDDLDEDKIREFVQISRSKRAFPFEVEADIHSILTHLSLMVGDRITNAAILLFGKRPQRFFITSEVKCAHFHGFEVIKPIPSYQVYKGDVFQLVEQAVDFVLSKIDLYVGSRDKSATVEVKYELPIEAVTEAIVNAVAHRDYTSNGSVQVMLFKDRLEIWNPGTLPYGLTTAKLYLPHHSIPANPLLAEPMYLRGTIERMGTGTGDIVRRCEEMSLPKPQFFQEDMFRTVLYRPEQEIRQVTRQATRQVTRQALLEENIPEPIKRIILVMNNEIKRVDLQAKLKLKDRENFVNNYLTPALVGGFLELSIPDVPNHPQQSYRLTQKGIELRTLIDNL